MPCENCPADCTTYCSACQDTPDLSEPRHLYAAGVSSGGVGLTLAVTIAAVQSGYGPLNVDQLEDLIQGWQVGSQDAAAYVADMVSGADLDSNPGPF